MRYPVYPEKLRKTAQFKLKVRYPLLSMLIAGIIMFITGFNRTNEVLMVAGALLCAAGFLFLTTFNAADALIMADIGDKEIQLLDAKGKAFRSTEYRYVRSIEVRALHVTGITSESSKYSDFPGGGIEAKLIMVYFDKAQCFEDLNLDRLSKKYDVYWCDKLFYHHNCIAFVYSDDAWKLLNAKLSAYSSQDA